MEVFCAISLLAAIIAGYSVEGQRYHEEGYYYEPPPQTGGDGQERSTAVGIGVPMNPGGGDGGFNRESLISAVVSLPKGSGTGANVVGLLWK